MVFEALVYLCEKTGEWKGSYSELARFSCCGSHQTAMRAVNKFVQNGLVVVQNGQIIVQNGQVSKEERTKEENKKINKSKHASSFEEFWNNFDKGNQWSRSKNRTRQYFETMPSDWQQLAIEKAKTATADRDPYWFLKDEDFLREEKPKNEDEPTDEPINYNGKKLDPKVTYVIARYKGSYGTYRLEDAKVFGMEIKK